MGKLGLGTWSQENGEETGNDWARSLGLGDGTWSAEKIDRTGTQRGWRHTAERDKPMCCSLSHKAILVAGS